MPRSSEAREGQERSPTRPFQISEQKPRPNCCWMPGMLQWESDPPEPHPPTGQSWCEAGEKRSRGQGIKPACQHGCSRAGTGAVPCAIQSCWVAIPTSRGAGSYSVELRSLHPDGKIHSNVLTTARSLTTQGALWWMKDGKAYFKIFSCLERQWIIRQQQILGFHLQKKPLCYACCKILHPNLKQTNLIHLSLWYWAFFFSLFQHFHLTFELLRVVNEMQQGLGVSAKHFPTLLWNSRGLQAILIHVKSTLHIMQVLD